MRRDDSRERAERNDFAPVVGAGSGALLALSAEAGVWAGAADTDHARGGDAVGIGDARADGGDAGAERRGAPPQGLELWKCPRLQPEDGCLGQLSGRAPTGRA
jgi:hypothetical protein